MHKLSMTKLLFFPTARIAFWQILYPFFYVIPNLFRDLATFTSLRLSLYVLPKESHWLDAETSSA